MVFAAPKPVNRGARALRESDVSTWPVGELE